MRYAFQQSLYPFVGGLDIMPSDHTLVKGFSDEFSHFYKIPKIDYYIACFIARLTFYNPYAEVRCRDRCPFLCGQEAAWPRLSLLSSASGSTVELDALFFQAEFVIMLALMLRYEE